jgi:hypothetical protein
MVAVAPLFGRPESYGPFAPFDVVQPDVTRVRKPSFVSERDRPSQLEVIGDSWWKPDVQP